MRPLFLHYEDDARAYTLKYQYLFGRDLLVAPVHEEGRTDWTLYLPQDNWVNAWTGECCQGGDVTVDAPLGKPPVFYRQHSEWADLCLAPYVISDKAQPAGNLRADGEQ